MTIAAVMAAEPTERSTVQATPDERPVFAEGPVDGWACGLSADGDGRAADGCRDIRPELIIELL
ncbi:MAG TPA: hypothetical protein VFN76_05370 [Candidatus Limnocylindria bacterium]|nr:hypothetical protein [Candidatus Limnocylindria bacterium]